MNTVLAFFSALGWFLILFYYIPFSITHAIRTAKKKTPLDTKTDLNINIT